MADKKAETKKTASINTKEFSWKSLITFIILFLFGAGVGVGVDMTVRPTEEGGLIIEASTIELSEEQIDAIIVNEIGEEEIVEIPTVEEINTNQTINDEDMPDIGQGAYHDTSSPEAYKNAVLGQCIDVDGWYGAQCFDLASDFWSNYAGRWLKSCGTGAAKGTIQDGCWQQNAGDDFEMIWDATKIQAGDWVVFTNGQYGHIGMALGGNNRGYVALLGQNQGGKSCEGGGAAANIINISLKNFGGAFRPKDYIIPEPEPEPVPDVPDTGFFTKEY